MRGIVAGIVVVALAAAVALFLFKDKGSVTVEKAAKKPTKVKEVTPAPAPKTPEPERELTEDEKRLAEIKRLKEKFGDNMPAGLKMHIYYLENPPKTVIKLKNPYEFLQHPSEQEIASIINIVPGTEMIEKPEFGESFNRDFINAMLDKIEINDDDSEEVRQMKSDVAEAKKQIAKICKEEGKKPNQVMSEYATSLFELSKYKLNLEEELRAANNNADISNADLQDYYRAANKILEKKGLDPIEVPAFKGRARRLERNQKWAASRAAREAEKNKEQ